MVIYLINLLNHRIIGNNYYTLNPNKYTSRALPKDPERCISQTPGTSPALVMANLAGRGCQPFRKQFQRRQTGDGSGEDNNKLPTKMARSSWVSLVAPERWMRREDLLFPSFRFLHGSSFHVIMLILGVYLYMYIYIGIILMQKWRQKMASCGFVTIIANYSSAF